jgi:hypothetical protein
MNKSFSFYFPGIFGCSHVGITRQYIVIIYWLRRAGAEQEGEEEEGH